MKKTLGQFRRVAFLEGWSFLLLLFVAMPLKYVWGIPEGVKYIGWAHGALFVAFSFLLALLKFGYQWSWGKSIGAFLASLLPFGTFIADKKWKAEYESL